MKALMIGVVVGLLVGAGVTYAVVRDDGLDRPVDEPTVTASPSPSSMPSDEPSPSPSPSPSPEQEPTGTALDESQPLRMDGIGAIAIGMTVDEMEEAIGSSIREPSDFGFRCRYAYPEDGPIDVALMLSRGRLVRVDIFNRSDIETVSGIGIGDTEDDVYAVYGDRLQREPHPYLGDLGSYLVYQLEGEDELLLIFETRRGKVISFRSGAAEQVRYIEGCA